MKARLTYDQKTNQVLAKIVKTRVADIDWHMPRCPVDCRLSINLEMDWDGDVRELEALLNNQSERPPDRIKDRLSYTHGHYQIDLTQVQSSSVSSTLLCTRSLLTWLPLGHCSIGERARAGNRALVPSSAQPGPEVVDWRASQVPRARRGLPRQCTRARPQG